MAPAMGRYRPTIDVELCWVVELIRLTIDQMLAETFPRFEKLTATIAFKRERSRFQIVR
jgi:hypothetical protein